MADLVDEGHVSARPSPGPRWAALGLLLLAVVLRLWDLGGQSFWYDEAYSWWLATQLTPAGSLASSLREFIPPLTYFVWRGWAALAGASELALRVSSALPGVLAVAAGARLCARLTRRRSGMLAALALFAIAPPLVWAAREMRMYAQTLALVLLAAVALLEVLYGSARRRRAWAWIWGVLALASLYALVLSALWLLGLGIFAASVLLLDGAPRSGWRGERVRVLLAPTLLAGLLYLPWLVPALAELGENVGYWPGTLPAGGFFARAFQGITVFRFWTCEPAAQRIGTVIVLFAVLAPVLVVPLRYASGRRGAGGGHSPLPLLKGQKHRLADPLRATRFLLCVGGVPLLLMSVLLRRMPKWDLQHAVLFAPPLYIALAAAGSGLVGVSSHRRGGLRRLGVLALGAGLGLVVLSLGLATRAQLIDPNYRRDDWRSLVAYVAEQRQPDDVVIIGAGFAYPAWAYYARMHPQLVAHSRPGSEALVRLPDDPLLDVRNVLDYATTAPVLNVVLPGANGVWLVGWLDHVTDPTGIVATLLEEVGTPQVVPAFHGLQLQRFVLEAVPAFPALPATTPLPAGGPLPALAPGLHLWGAKLPSVPVSADRPLAVRTWWTIADATAHAGRVYQGTLRIYDGLGHLWARHDAPPGGGDYRPERWPVESLVLGRFDALLMPGAPPGVYTATLALYEVGAAGLGAVSPELTLGQVRVAPPVVPPPVPAAMAAVETVRDSGLAPLRLLAASTAQATLRPCETLGGRLFWEVIDPLTVPLVVRVTLGVETVEVDLAADFGAVDWRPGERSVTPFRLPVDCRALPYGAAELEVALLDLSGEALGVWRGPPVAIAVQRLFSPPAALAVSPLTAFGALDGSGDVYATLLGYTLQPPEVRAGEPFSVTLVWRAGEALSDVPYTVFVHLTPLDEPGPVLVQHDGWPARGQKPTYTWVAGEVVVDSHPLDPLPRGNYAVRVGLYRPDGMRLPAAAPQGTSVYDDTVMLTTLEVR